VSEVRWTGDGFDRLKTIPGHTDFAIRRSLEVVGRMLQRSININLSGRVLNRRSGDLIRSWQNRKVATIPGGWRASIWSSNPYSRIHELGGKTGRNHATTIPARPYVWTALERNKARILKEVGDSLHQVVRKT